MTTDGSNLGITSQRAIDTILGGEPAPIEEEEQTPEQVLERINAATVGTYDGATDVLTRVMLRAMTENPNYQELPLDAPYAYVVVGSGTTLSTFENTRVVAEGTYEKVENMFEDEHEYVYVNSADTLWDRAKEAAFPHELPAFEGATGFMAGFAYNQAHWLLNLPTVDNPAIINVGSIDAEEFLKGLGLTD